jgi:hypothetical protein
LNRNSAGNETDGNWCEVEPEAVVGDAVLGVTVGEVAGDGSFVDLVLIATAMTIATTTTAKAANTVRTVRVTRRERGAVTSSTA